MTNTNITEKEMAALNTIHEIMDMYGDGFSDAMIEDIAAITGENIMTTKGVLGSLVKKEMISMMDVNGEYNVYIMAKTGCDALGIRPDYYDMISATGQKG